MLLQRSALSPDDPKRRHEPVVICQGYTTEGNQPQRVPLSTAHVRAMRCPERCVGCQSQGQCNPPLRH